MEWRDVPGYPGYQVSERGGLRTGTGYVLPRRGRRYSLHREGQTVRLKPEELMALAWPVIAPAVATQEATAEDSNWLLQQPVNEITVAASAVRAQRVTDDDSNLLPKRTVKETAVAIRMARQLADDWRIRKQAEPANGYREELPDPAPPAPEQSLTEPAAPPVRERKAPAQPRGKIRQFGNREQRRCHDCGKPTNNYRCDACWARLRGYEPGDAGEWNLL